MPYYLITIKTFAGKVYCGVKYDRETDIDVYYKNVWLQTHAALKTLFVDIDVVMLWSGSKEVSDYLEKGGQRDPSEKHFG
jgi:hypothetical protein